MIKGLQQSNLLSELPHKMAKHHFNPGVRTHDFKLGKNTLKTGGVTFKKGSTTDRTKAPEVQANDKRFTQNEGA